MSRTCGIKEYVCKVWETSAASKFRKLAIDLKPLSLLLILILGFTLPIQCLTKLD